MKNIEHVEESKNLETGSCTYVEKYDKYGFTISPEDDEFYETLYNMLPKSKEEVLGLQKWVAAEIEKLKTNKAEYLKEQFEFSEKYIAAFIEGFSNKENDKEQQLYDAAEYLETLNISPINISPIRGN